MNFRSHEMEKEEEWGEEVEEDDERKNVSSISLFSSIK